MSNLVAALVQRRKIGGGTRKSVMMYLADRASDDGSGIWTSKGHIAADTEFAKRSVVGIMGAFETEGLIEKIGTRKCQNGFTYEYRIILDAIRALPDTREKRGAGDSPVQEIHLTGAGDSPQGVQEIHPNHPLTTHEPSNTPKPPEGAADLFSANGETDQQGGTEEKPDPVEGGFEEFWKAIWPKHPRKTGKADCLKVYRAACTGKHPKADKISPEELNRCAVAYLASVRDPQFIKGTLPWLRQPGWEPFMEAETGAEYREEDLTPSRRSMLQDGICPPSMKGSDGRPNAEARYWLKRYGHGGKAV